MVALPDFQNTEIAFRAKTTGELYRARLLFQSMGWPMFVKTGTFFLNTALTLRFPVRPIVRPTLFAHFCGGESVEEAGSLSKKLESYRIGSVLDYSIEGQEQEADFDSTTTELLKTIEFACGNLLPFAVFKVTGIARFGLLEKKSAKQPLSPDEASEWARIVDRVLRLCQKAAQKKVCLLIDAEESWIQDAIDELAESMMARFNQNEPVIYHTLQMYRHDRYAYLEGLHHTASSEGWQPGIKLVRGAYMEKERLRASRLKQVSPIHPDKKSTDQDYNKALSFCVRHHERIGLFAGTHNEASSLYLCELMDKYKIHKDDIGVVFSQLLGMSDHISFNLAHSGYLVAKYVPYGPVRDALPYLFRRAEENSSIQGQASREFDLLSSELERRRKG